MKQSISIFLVCILFSCNKQHTHPAQHDTHISVIHDVTDQMICQPVADPILALYQFDLDKDQEAHLRLVLLTDQRLNPIEEIQIASGDVTEQNNVNDEVDYRERLVYSFYDKIRNVFSDLHTQSPATTSLKHSECYATIASEIEILAASKAAQRILIVYSDLQENSEFSCYTQQGRDLLEHKPEQVKVLLQKIHPLPDSLQGLNVYFVYNPKNREQDIAFSKMMSIYMELLHSRGARVIVQASNKSYQQ